MLRAPCDLCPSPAAVWLFHGLLCGACAWERLEGDGPEAVGFERERVEFIEALVALDSFEAVS